MRWQTKVIVQKACSAIPRGEVLYYFCQRFVTRSLPSSEGELELSIKFGLSHLQNFARYYTSRLETAQLFEFGAGWDFVIPLTFVCHGAKHQTLIDISKSARRELIVNAMERLGRRFNSAALTATAPRVAEGGPDALKHIGIRYIAPMDATRTSFEPHQFDLISNTNTFEHIPAREIGPVFKECFRILKPGGIMSCLVDYTDHYSHTDNRISCYNFLKFSPLAWRMLNCSLHFQNRWRHPQYIAAAREAGFQVLSEQRKEATEADIEFLRRTRLAEEFRSQFTTADLGVKSASIVLKKPE